METRPRSVRLKSSDVAAIIDRGILEKYVNKTITIEQTRYQIEKNNKCQFDSDKHFIAWAGLLGYWR